MKFIKTMGRNIRRSPYQAFAAIFIMTLTFLTVSFFVFILTGSSKVIDFFESKPQVTAFFKNEAKQEEIETLSKQVQATGKAASIKFISKEQALEIYKEQNKDDPLLLDLVTAEILPASLEVSTYKIEDLTSISDALKTSPIVSEVIYQKDIVSTLVSWTSTILSIRTSVSLVIEFSSLSIFLSAVSMSRVSSVICSLVDEILNSVSLI